MGERPFLRDTGEQPFLPAWALLRVGLYRARTAVPPPAGWCRSYRHPFTLTCCGTPRPAIGVSFCGHCPEGHTDWPLAAPLLCGVPTFLDQRFPCRGHPGRTPALRLCHIGHMGG